MQLVEAQDLQVFYGESHVLHGVSLSIERGEAVGLLGRNGMGKTTLIRTLLSQLRAARGTVRVRGIGCNGTPPYLVARQGIGYVPEGRGIFPNLNVRENLVMAARAGVDGRRDWTLGRVLELFPRLGERLHHPGDQLSGGEQQMLAIGRALLTNPDLLVMDEATEGLAPLVVEEIWQTIARLRGTVIAHTDRCVVLEKGRVVLAESSLTLSQQPERVARILGV